MAEIAMARRRQIEKPARSLKSADAGPRRASREKGRSPAIVTRAVRRTAPSRLAKTRAMSWTAVSERHDLQSLEGPPAPSQVQRRFYFARYPSISAVAARSIAACQLGRTGRPNKIGRAHV